MIKKGGQYIDSPPACSTETGQVRRAVLLCTSPLQVVGARAAADQLSRKDGVLRKIVVVMIHPSLTPQAKLVIGGLSKSLGCSGTFDLTEVYDQLLNNKRRTEGEPRNRLLKSVREILRLVHAFAGAQKQAKQIMEVKFGHIDEVFCREGAKQLDRMFLDAIGVAGRVMSVEDGIGDYISSRWKYLNWNSYEVGLLFRTRFNELAKFSLALLLTRQVRVSRTLIMRPQINWCERFSILPRAGETLMKDDFVNCLKKISRSKDFCSDKKILILGSLISGPGHPFTVSQEVELYNEYVDRIIEKHRVAAHQIWYKHHPRITKEVWAYKKCELHCEVYDYSIETIAELEIINPHVLAVYSVGTSALLYAKMIFGKQAYLIDLSSFPRVHPSAHRKYKYLADRYGVSSL